MSTIRENQPDVRKDEGFLDQHLRPGRFDEYVGQKHIKENLSILLGAAKERSHPPEHLLFYGPPGLGKTTLAHLVATETGSHLKVTSGPAIEKVGDLASVLTNLEPGEVLFIDEIHRLNKAIEEVLYPAMEAGNLNIIIGKGPSARTIQLELPPFTLIAATTRIALVSAPLRSRFSGGVFRLDFYTNQEIEEIIRRSARILAVQADPEAIAEIAKRARFTPRTANYLLKRVRDFAQIKRRELSKELVEEALTLLGVDKEGLTETDRKILDTVISKFSGGPVGLGTLAASLSEDEATIEEYNEPYLIQIGFLERTPRGRVATKHAYAHAGKVGRTEQKKLL
jgi:Holliday junction DNA helicase RuvB